MLIVFVSCNEDNQPPFCIIVSPANKSTFSLGDIIYIQITASDPEGRLNDIRLNFDGALKATLNSAPYEYELSSDGIIPGDYTIQAVATDDGGLEDIDEIQITFEASIPNVLTISVDSITKSRALVWGEAITSGGSDITERGICWNTLENPTLSGNHTMEGSGLGTFSSTLPDLLCSTEYFVRTFATNSIGTAYGNQLSFMTDSCFELPEITTTKVSSIGDLLCNRWREYHS